MLKTSMLFLVLSGWLSVSSGQRLTHRDSIVKVARADARNFRLDQHTWKKYRHTLPYTCDYFKPNTADVKNATLLGDSAYVDAYRHAAYKRNKRRHTPWHYVLIGGGVIVGAWVVLAATIIIVVGPTMN